MRTLLLLFVSVTLNALTAQQNNDWGENKIIDKKYKALMYDNTVNFYTVVEEAEKYFSSIDRFAKGSGWKGFQRWQSLNEYKYYPSGDRHRVDPNFAGKQFRLFLKQNNKRNKILHTDSWKDLGPYTIDSITGHYSAGLGRVEDFYVDPNDSNLIYLGSRSGGFWKTTNGGDSWSGGYTDTLVASGVDIIAVSPTNPDSILINVKNAQNNYSHGVYRSIDGGTSWIESNFNPTTVGSGGLGSTFRIYSIVYHPRIKDLIFIGTNRGLYRSDDNLQTWSRIETALDVSQITVHPISDDIMYFYDRYYFSSQHDVIYYSTDTGKTFTQSSTIEKNNIQRTVRLSVSKDCPDCLYYASTSGVWKSTDKGLTFTTLSNPDETCRAFAVSQSDTSNMIYGYLDLEKSTDGGQTFTQTTRWSLGNTNGSGNGNQESYQESTDYIHADMRNAKYIDDKFYVATDGFLSKSSDNGTSWEIISEGTGIRENYKLGVSQSNHYRTMCGSQDNGTSFLTEKGWVEAYGADGMEAVIHPLNSDFTIFSLQYGGRRKSINGALSNTGANPSGSRSADWIAPLAFDPNNHFTIYDFRDSVYKSEDFADTYTLVGGPTTFTGNIDRAAIAENNSDVIVISQGRFIEKSTDGGLTFSSIKIRLPNASIEDIAFDPNNDSVIAIVYGNYQSDNSKIYITTDQGTSWTNVTHNLGSMPLRSVVIDHTDSSNIYVGAEIGVYVKSMDGNNWELYNTNLPNMSVRELEIVNGSNTIRAATWGRGLWEINLRGRKDYPSIVSTSITQTPTLLTPKEGVDQKVTSLISYGDSLTNVFVKWSVNSLTLDSLIAMSNISDSTWESDKDFPSGKTGDKLYFKVFAVGDNNDTSETYRFMYEVREAEYCDATGNSGAGNLYISNVTLENLNNNSTNNSYSKYNSPIVKAYIDSTYNLSVQANTSWSQNDFSAWIDFDSDFVFSNSERIMSDENAGGSSSVKFTVPKHAKEGDTILMRIRLSYFGSQSACGNQFGEVEDYLLLIKEIPELTYSINKDSLCYGETFKCEYTGGNLDSLEWTFTNGTYIETSKQLVASKEFIEIGDYDISIRAYYDNNLFELDSANAFFVRDSFDLEITQTTNTLTVNQSGVNYQWIDCSNGNIEIAGALSASYSPSSNGDYAVELSNTNCVDTSECMNYTLVGLDEVSLSEDFKVYPNPTDGKIILETELRTDKKQFFQLIDITGKVVLKKQISRPKEYIDLEYLARGIYYFQFNNEFKKLILVD